MSNGRPNGEISPCDARFLDALRQAQVDGLLAACRTERDLLRAVPDLCGDFVVCVAQRDGTMQPDAHTQLLELVREHLDLNLTVDLDAQRDLMTDSVIARVAARNYGSQGGN